MDDCVFCNIINRTIDSEIIFEDDKLIVIKDILPKAPVHLLVISKEHILSLSHLEEKHKELVWDAVTTAKNMAEKFGVNQTGYKLLVNVGRDGGQVIPHLHLHVIGGKNLGE
jgi:histidine triad (HIT) family protein